MLDLKIRKNTNTRYTSILVNKHIKNKSYAINISWCDLLHSLSMILNIATKIIWYKLISNYLLTDHLK